MMPFKNRLTLALAYFKPNGLGARARKTESFSNLRGRENNDKKSCQHKESTR